jgi:serine/threonine-protein kinase HipA
MKEKMKKKSVKESDSRLRRLFNVPWAPKIPFGMKDLPEQVRRSVGKMSLSGVQIKASVVLNKKDQQLEIAEENGAYILKPDLPQFPQIALVENISMDMADDLEMEVPPHAVLPMADGCPAYIIKRFDRLPRRERIHKEDMAQLLGMTTESKYDGSLEKVGKAIRTHASNVFLDLINFYERVLFCFLIGNGDMHLKNWALLDNGSEIKLAPCYDLVASRLYIPDEDESALTINGKRNKLNQADFNVMANTLDLDKKSVSNIFGNFKSKTPALISMVQRSDLNADRKKDWVNLIKTRSERVID